MSRVRCDPPFQASRRRVMLRVESKPRRAAIRLPLARRSASSGSHLMIGHHARKYGVNCALSFGNPERTGWMVDTVSTWNDSVVAKAAESVGPEPYNLECVRAVWRAAQRRFWRQNDPYRVRVPSLSANCSKRHDSISVDLACSRSASRVARVATAKGRGSASENFSPASAFSSTSGRQSR